MKQILSFSIALIFTLQVYAQAPGKISYQALIRNTSNALLINQAVGMRISILQGSVNGTVVYAETHSTATNPNGLVSIEIGGGTVVSGSFAVINWASGPYFVKTETDISGGINYTITGTSQLLSVPYALYAAQSGNNAPGPQGLASNNGVDGTAVLNGAADPTANTGVDGDFYINTTNNTLFGPKTAGAWPTGISLVGKQGNSGNDGINGATVLNGSSDPASNTGVNGDFYLNTNSKTLFGPKLSGAWPAGVSLIGKQGKTNNGLNGNNGSTILNGITDPAVGTGADGDFYLNTKTNTLFGPKTSGTWTKSVSLVGPPGSTGSGEFNHYIGEQFGGGVIFHLWKDEKGLEHGLIVDPTAFSLGYWSNVDQTLIGISAKSTWDGLSNCNAIVAQAGHTSSAAALCLNSTNGGQNDWYLPAIDELRLLFSNRYIVNKTLVSIGGQAAKLYPNAFFSSTEDSSNQFKVLSFTNATSFDSNKSGSGYRFIRAVRAL